MQDRAAILLKIADRMEQNPRAVSDSRNRDNGKPIRETSAADVPLAIDYLWLASRPGQEGGISALIAKPWPIISMNR